MQQVGATRSPAALVTTIKPSLFTGALLVSIVLSGCSTNTPAPITDIHSSTPMAPTSTEINQNYTVQPGDTLYKIAQQHGTSVQAIVDANNITDPAQLRVGQVLAVAGAGAGSSQTRPTPPASTEVVTAPVTTEPPAEQVTPPPTATSPVATDTSPRASDANLINWGWPASGTLIQGFTASTKGIDIQGTIGDPVVAAANGKVMYAGNGVRGLGNLILLGHSNGFITAYAHNDALLVKTGEEIKKGQKIATLGQSDTSSPRLHFEVRRRGTPVNPLSYLPAR